MQRWILRLVLTGMGLFIALQVLPIGPGASSPQVVADAPWPSEDARELAVAACYDCHSNETRWPWYARVAPMSWLVQRDVAAGREELNFSEWPADRADDMVEVVVDGEMPPRRYLLAHPEARLSSRQRARLVEALDRLAREAEGGDDGRD